jgi:NADH-quinone oxidoreductase subunit E
MLRRLHPDQPDSFAFTPANQAWAETQITKYPEGRQASAIIPLLWRAQEQEGWLTRPAIEHVSEMLGMAYIRGLEVATFYFMFQLAPVGSVAHVQVCGTTSCMICGAEDLMKVCMERIAPRPHELSADGKFSWEEVECLGACSNAPMAQIGKDYYEDLTTERLAEIIDEMAAGRVPVPGPQNGRYASEPKEGLSSLKDHEEGRAEYNASAQLAVDIGDTIKRIDGTEVPLTAPWQRKDGDEARDAEQEKAEGDSRDDLMPPDGRGGRGKDEAEPPRNVGDSSDKYSETEGEAEGVEATGKPDEGSAGPRDSVAGTPAEEGHPAPASAGPDKRPAGLDAPREAGADDLKRIKGVGPKLEKQLNAMGYYHYDQVAGWTDEEAAWVDTNLEGFKGRATRDGWVTQARGLSQGRDSASARREEEDGTDQDRD